MPNFSDDLKLLCIMLVKGFYQKINLFIKIIIIAAFKIFINLRATYFLILHILETRK